MSLDPRDLVLLDTNVLIHVLRGKDTGKHIDATYRLSKRIDKPLISVVTVGECLAFAAKRQWGPKKVEELEGLLRELVVVDINHELVLRAYAQIDMFSQNVGRKMSKNDLWIAACASVASAVLMTCDGDFDHLAATPYLKQLEKVQQLTGTTVAMAGTPAPGDDGSH